ncbi:hypothetical protein K3495_g11202 [Podosphaera aphanis]|nr:hypothetical protein K3495_g11202 [Podosphaera aphanis]
MSWAKYMEEPLISASRLITSYALPPQSCFTCPPCSLRTKSSKSKIDRRTYVAVINARPQITLFHDSKENPGETTCREISQDIGGSSGRAVFIGTITATGDAGTSTTKADVIIVKKDCEIQCYDGENLLEKWTSPASALFQESQSKPDDATVEYAQVTNAYSASQGILKNRPDVFAMFTQEITKDGFNPELLVIVTKSEKQAFRTLHIVSLPRKMARTVGWKNHRWVETLLVSQVPFSVGASSSRDEPNISIQASVQTMQHLENGVLTIYDLTQSLPKLQHQVNSPGAQSFIRLSSTLSMISTGDIVSIYNLKYHSQLATVGLDFTGHESLKRKRGSDGKLSHTCKLVSYLPKLAVVVAIIGSNLIGIQMEGQEERFGRRQTAGLLIDSLGSAISEEVRPSVDGKQIKKKSRNEFQTLKQVKRLDTITQAWPKLLEPIEKAITTGDCTGELFDQLMAPYFVPEKCDATPGKINEKLTPGCKETNPVNSVNPLQVDKKLVIYALGKIFNLSESKNGEKKLSISLYAQNTFTWLVQRGYMTTVNIESALKNQGSTMTTIPAGDLTRLVMELDPQMNLLFALITKNHLGADEILHVIRELMECMGLWGNNSSTKKELLNDEQDDCESKLLEGRLIQEPAHSEMEVDRDTGFAKKQFGSSSGIRGEALTHALSKLYSYPDESIVRALQINYTPQATACLIYLLRFELARGGWTTRYLDTDAANVIGDQVNRSENIILLISNLLSCCVDAIGAGGWLSGETRLLDGDPFEAEELISSLKIEVSATLEGIEEMVYLQGMLGEIVRYGDLVQKDISASRAKDPLKPITLLTEQTTSSLPLGLKTEKQISLVKMRSGGEMIRRTMRDVGDLKSRKVEKYSRERINV